MYHIKVFQNFWNGSKISIFLSKMTLKVQTCHILNNEFRVQTNKILFTGTIVIRSLQTLSSSEFNWPLNCVYGSYLRVAFRVQQSIECDPSNLECQKPRLKGQLFRSSSTIYCTTRKERETLKDPALALTPDNNSGNGPNSHKKEHKVGK